MPVMSVTLANGRQVKLGRNRPKARPQALAFRHYLGGLVSVSPPTKVDYATKALPALRRMYLNDTYGDCVIAGKYHQLGVWSANDPDGPGVIQGTDDEVYAQYQKICGPGDNGCIITDVLDVMKSRGLPAQGKYHKIDGYVAIDWTNKLEVQVALYLFGSLTIGINLPDDWTTSHGTWDITNSQIVGGHDVCCVGYDENGVQIATWGGIVTIAWRAFTSKRWLEECYAQLAPLWYNDDRLSPVGVNVEALKVDLAKLESGEIPDIGPTPPPPSPPTPPPPTPPVPPAPPPESPVYSITVSGQVPSGIFGHMTNVTLSGLASPVEPSVKSAVDLTSIPWGKVIADILAIVAAYKSNDLVAVANAIAQLLKDLGINLP